MKSLYSLLLISIFFLSLSLALLLLNFRLVFLNPQSLKDVLSDANAYEKFTKETLPSVLLNSIESPSSTQIDKDFYSNVSKNLIDPNFLKNDVETFLDSLIPYLNSEKDALNFTFKLKPYKETVSENLEPTLEAYFSNLPVCAPSSEVNLPTEEAILPFCRPENVNAEEFFRQTPIKDIENEILTQFPNEVIISEEKIEFKNENSLITENESNVQRIDFKSAKGSINSGKIILFLSFIFTFLSAALLYFVWRKNLRSFFYWFSLALFLSSLLPLILSIGVLTIPFEEDSFGAFEVTSGTTYINFNVFVEIAISILKRVANYFFIEAVIMLIAAIFLFIYPKFLKGKI